jgi:hypothetical protein
LCRHEQEERPGKGRPLGDGGDNRLQQAAQVGDIHEQSIGNLERSGKENSAVLFCLTGVLAIACPRELVERLPR